MQELYSAHSFGPIQNLFGDVVFGRRFTAYHNEVGRAKMSDGVSRPEGREMWGSGSATSSGYAPLHFPAPPAIFSVFRASMTASTIVSPSIE